MLVAQFARDCLVPNFKISKISVLCATILIPGMALADPPGSHSDIIITQATVKETTTTQTVVAHQAAVEQASTTPTTATITSTAATSFATSTTTEVPTAPPTAVSVALAAQTVPVTTVASVSDTAAQTTPTVTTKAPEGGKASNLARHLQDKYKLSETKASQIVQEAIVNGDRHQLEPELILAVIAVESMFRERAVSRVGARGLMQVMPRVHRDKLRHIGGTRALFDPAKNIHTGSQILVGYLNNHAGNLRRALLNYNGSLGMRSSYADRVMKIYSDFQKVTTEG